VYTIQRCDSLHAWVRSNHIHLMYKLRDQYE